MGKMRGCVPSDGNPMDCDTRYLRRKKTQKILKKAAISVLIAVVSIVILILAAFMFMFYSPWTEEYRDQYILMTYKTSNPWLCTLFFSDETIEEVFANNGSTQPTGKVDESLINPQKPSVDEESIDVSEAVSDAESSTDVSDTSDVSDLSDVSDVSDVSEVVDESITEESEEDKTERPDHGFKVSDKYDGEIIYDDGEVQIVEFAGTTEKGEYTARLIQIKDPSRVFLGVSYDIADKDDIEGNPGSGETVAEMCITNNALCGINASGFLDIGGVGNGGIPIGIIVKDGEYAKYSDEPDHTVIGFNKDNILVMGKFSEEEIAEQGIRDAMSWREPSLLVLNGQVVPYYGMAGGYDPRSAIGQCADGTVLLLVADGSKLRGIDGANFSLMADILYSFGAVNAANLDGGTSASMALNGRIINTVCNPAIAKYGRHIPTAWLVKKSTDDE